MFSVRVRGRAPNTTTLSTPTGRAGSPKNFWFSVQSRGQGPSIAYITQWQRSPAQTRLCMTGNFDPVVSRAEEVALIKSFKAGASDDALFRGIEYYIKPYETCLSSRYKNKPLPEVELSRVQTALGTVLTRFWGCHDEPKPSTTAVEPETYESNYDRDTAFLASYNKQDVGGWF